jgi:hypothetical protein
VIEKLIRRFSRYPNVAGVRPRSLDLLACTRPNSKPSSILALQSVCDRFYFLLFGAISAHLGERVPLRADLVMTQSVSGAIGTGLLAELKRSAPAAWLRSAQWVRAYGRWIDRIAYRSASWSHPVTDIKAWFLSKRLWQALQLQRGEFSLQLNGVEVADLLIDSYLRFRPSPTFVVHDPFVRRLIWQALRDEHQARAYFERVRPAWYLSSHTTYLEHGIPVRVALAQGVDVWSFGNLNGLGKKLSREDFFHTPNFSSYSSGFNALDRQDERLAQAQVQLERRLSGSIDSATSYMRQSAYANINMEVSLPPNLKGAVVVFLHDFYDSPHVYPDLVFNDFWDWICLTITTLHESGITFFLKPHPNQIALSDEALSRLQAQYPSLVLLPAGISNVQLAKAGIACGVTVYGTVAHEMAYLGIPTIGCARHPHHSFDFCRTAKSRVEYVAMLRSPKILPLSVEAMQRQALIFYYMHNIHGTDSERALADSFITLWRECNFGNDPEELINARLQAFTALPGFDDFISCLSSKIEVSSF